MNRQVALLRGINVGRAKRVAMADLRALVADLGYSDVRTLLNSGNVVYTVPPRLKGDAAAHIQDAIAERLGVSARVVTVTADALASVVSNNPLRGVADDPARLLVAFLADPADLSRLQPLTRQDWAPEALAVGRHAAYLWCASGIIESRLLQAVGRLIKDGLTTRNWATVLKLQAMVAERS
jgi:uncharacterized protein (DUF1697 family)